MNFDKEERSSGTGLRKAANKEVEFNQEVVLKNTFKTSIEEGFELMFRYYYTPLCSNAIRIVYDREAAEDIVADVFEDFWEKRVHTEMKTSYKAYLYQAVRNKSLNYLHRITNKNYVTDELNEEVLNKGFHVTPEDIVNFHELIQNLEKAIGSLPKQSRRAFQLHRLDGKRYSEIAEELNITVSAVERLISRALKKIKEALSNETCLSLLLLLIAN
ncbi:RNA polymerase sigma-70 factor [Marinilongibacter aquaticus]|uniref:RNA polymerase sigma-70 factor n=1 Tax=Marinilongibacter aquaticus TaxID=2975157 RepID=UPI0021BD4DED|nr:RNA polymerase sigma-70 factor [Marinilongibacter aquaticus]UBM59188.1 RNA polymerase sigma-70 factor [Marinilongibacter aquaticus]